MNISNPEDPSTYPRPFIHSQLTGMLKNTDAPQTHNELKEFINTTNNAIGEYADSQIKISRWVQILIYPTGIAAFVAEMCLLTNANPILNLGIIMATEVITLTFPIVIQKAVVENIRNEREKRIERRDTMRERYYESIMGW